MMTIFTYEKAHSNDKGCRQTKKETKEEEQTELVSLITILARYSYSWLLWKRAIRFSYLESDSE